MAWCNLLLLHCLCVATALSSLEAGPEQATLAETDSQQLEQLQWQLQQKTADMEHLRGQLEEAKQLADPRKPLPVKAAPAPPSADTASKANVSVTNLEAAHASATNLGWIGAMGVAPSASIQVGNNAPPKKNLPHEEPLDWSRGNASCIISSGDFLPGAMMPRKFLCAAKALGDNWTPELNVDVFNADADALYAVWLEGEVSNLDGVIFVNDSIPLEERRQVHWMLYDIPSQVLQLSAGLCKTVDGQGNRILVQKGHVPEGFAQDGTSVWVGQAENMFGKWHYTGPCPAPNKWSKYTYHAIVYQVPVQPVMRQVADWRTVLEAISNSSVQTQCKIDFTASNHQHNYTMEMVIHDNAAPYCYVNPLAEPVQLYCGNMPLLSGSWEVLDTYGQIVAHIPTSNGENLPNWSCAQVADQKYVECSGDAPDEWTARDYCLRKKVANHKLYEPCVRLGAKGSKVV